MNKKTKGILLLLVTSLIWGLAFIFQSAAAESINAFLFNGLRFIIGSICFIPLLYKYKIRFNRRTILIGFITGLFVFGGMNLQQYGLQFIEASKAGFLTTIYLIIVPAINYILFKEKTTSRVVISAIIVLVGIFFLTNANSGLEYGDLVIIGSSLFFALQIVFINQFGQQCDIYLFSFTQYLTVGIISLVVSILTNSFSLESIYNARISLIYTGILSTAVAYTFQTVGQKHIEPTVASIILSFESVFAAIGGVVLLNESLTVNEIFGCLLMFIGLIYSQIKKRKTSFL